MQKPAAWRVYLPNFLILIVMMAASAFFAGSLPEQIATQFDVAGNPTRYSDRLGTLVLLPTIYVVSLFLLPLLIRLSPRNDQNENASALIPKTNTAVGILITCIHVGILMMAIDRVRFPIDRPIVIGMSLFLMYLANVLGGARRNFFIGIRTPWSLASEANWNATHKIASRVAALTGALLLLASLFARPSLFLAIVSIVFAMMVPVFYSLWYFQNFEKSADPGGGTK